MRTIVRASKMNHVHVDIRGELFMRALDMQKQGIDVLKLNTGNPAAFGFGLPDSIRHALDGHLNNGVGYCDFRGMPEARKAICDYETSKGIKGITPDDVYIGNGVSECVSIALTTFLDPGEELLVPSPSYSLWGNTALISGGTPVFYLCDEASGWYPDLNDIRSKITKNTKAIVIINPNNPTGALYPKEVLLDILQIAREHELVVFSDEIYDRLVMDGEQHISTASLAEDLVVVTMNGLSKSHCLCGYRCGWMVLSGPENSLVNYRKGIIQLTSLRLCANTLPQLAIPAALKDMETPHSMVAPGGRLYEQRETVTRELEKIDGISFVKNKAAFYLFPKLDRKKFAITDDKQFARDLLEETHILVIPGSGFDWNTPDHFRIVMLPEKEVLKTAMQKIGRFLDGYSAKTMCHSA